MSFDYEPLGDGVLISRDQPKETTESGLIHVPDTAKDIEHVATVVKVSRNYELSMLAVESLVAVLEDKEASPDAKATAATALLDRRWVSGVRVNDRVFTARRAGSELKSPEGRRLQFVRTTDILGRVIE
jgi:co-chaperonin GroES (HSP10)